MGPHPRALRTRAKCAFFCLNHLFFPDSWGPQLVRVRQGGSDPDWERFPEVQGDAPEEGRRQQDQPSAEPQADQRALGEPGGKVGLQNPIFYQIILREIYILWGRFLWDNSVETGGSRVSFKLRYSAKSVSSRSSFRCSEKFVPGSWPGTQCVVSTANSCQNFSTSG